LVHKISHLDGCPLTQAIVHNVFLAMVVHRPLSRRPFPLFTGWFRPPASALPFGRQPLHAECQGEITDGRDGDAPARIFFTMAGTIGPSALAFSVMSEKRLATLAVSAVGFVAAVLVASWLVLGLLD
jgi:hypothetical protein